MMQMKFRIFPLLAAFVPGVYFVRVGQQTTKVVVP